MKHLRVYGLTCLFLLAAVAASATTIVLPTDEQLVSKTPVIVQGTVITSGPVERNGGIWTETTLRVEKTIKGTAPETVTIVEIGGEIDGRITKVFGSPEYTPGERVLVFLRPQADGVYRTVDLFVGKFRQAKMLNGRALWHRDDVGSDASLLDANFEPVEAKNVQRDAGAFEAFIVDRIAGRKSMRSYAIENPVLEQTETRSGRLGGASSNFTLISEPTIFRWTGFDNGGTARWVHHGSQSGYSSGGVGELTTAMSSWTSYSQAKINYTYVGAGTGNPGSVSVSNGSNEVLFNDPRGDIEGSWSASSGGTVGLGGFSGARSGPSWTAPFTADAEHQQGTYSSVTITEGNLAIQDGVSPSTGISSTRLAEILAHEFGHTLGFGHSSDSNALMYFRVTGQGPSLRADDQVAARWLYPNGTVAPPPTAGAPAAPSGLSATANASSVSLAWTDNSSNETGFAVYVAAGSGSFNRAGEVGANSRAATLNGLANGSYRIYVTAFNTSGESAASNTASVTVGGTPTPPAPAVAAFSVNQTSGTAATTTFVFTDQSTGSIASRQWSFGDGTSSSAQNPSHVYANPGTFTVRLTVTGTDGGTSNATRTITVVGPFAAAFTFSPSNPTTNDTVNFTDQSSGGATSWLWNFGDGSSSSERNPQKRYTVAGAYTVMLTVFRGAESQIAQQTVIVSQPAPALPNVTASFDIPSSGITGKPITFSDRSQGSPDRWSWSFGDGATSIQRNPTHTYASPGTYTVTLVAGNASSSSTASRQITIANEVIAYRSLISATAQTSGLGGSVWRTELSIFNAGSEAASVDLIFIPGAGGAVQTRSIFVPSRQSVTYGNALRDVFGLSTGAGALAIEASSATTSPDLRVSSRTFTETGSTGTYGQSVPDVPSDGLAETVYLTGLASNASYRTNIGLVNRTASGVTTTLTLYDRDGDTVASANVIVPANNFQQSGLTALFPQLSGRTFDTLSLRVSAAVEDAISAYASVVDNRTQDPVYVQGLPAPSGASLIVPAIGRAAGANGTFWRSDVTLFNPSRDRMLLGIRYLVAGADNRGASTSSVSLSAGQTFVLADILSALGVQSGSGALEVTWGGGTGPIVGSRTYTSTTSGGTFGQSIDPIASYGSDVYVAGLRSDGQFRSNVGFVNGSTETIGVNVELISATGAVVGTGFVTLQPKSQMQWSVAALFPNVNVASLGAFTLRATTNAASARLFAYGSIVDNTSGDPVFFAGR